ncbi:MAG: hypothetical protein J6W35_07090 [Eubacterium sp.]|nr:hypothetical protein [Eubacterium sp.]
MKMLLTVETFDFDLEGFTYHHFDDIDDSALWAHVEYLCETKNFFSLATLNKDHLREYLENMELSMSTEDLIISKYSDDEGNTLYKTEQLVYSDFGLLSVKELINRYQENTTDILNKMFIYAGCIK